MTHAPACTSRYSATCSTPGGQKPPEFSPPGHEYESPRAGTQQPFPWQHRRHAAQGWQHRRRTAGSSWGCAGGSTPPRLLAACSDVGAPPHIPPSLREPPYAAAAPSLHQPGRASRQRPAGLPQPHSPACRAAWRGSPSPRGAPEAGGPAAQAGPLGVEFPLHSPRSRRTKRRKPRGRGRGQRAAPGTRQRP